MLKFSDAKENKKLKVHKGMFTFSLLSGWSCPCAKDCFSKVVDGKIKDGKDTQFRCFSASQEASYPNVFKQRKHNFDLLNKEKNKKDLIVRSLPDAEIYRVHVGGDFFNQDYFDAWLKVASEFPKRIFYAYTKSLNYWAKRLDSIPDNFKLNASKGGKFDYLIPIHNFKVAEVVFSEEEAKEKGLEIDYDDSHAFKQDKSFALLLHGTQPKGSFAADALKKIRSII